MINNLALRVDFKINNCLVRIKKFTNFTLDEKKPAQGWFFRMEEGGLAEAGVVHFPFADNEPLDVKLLFFVRADLPFFVGLVVADHNQSVF